MGFAVGSFVANNAHVIPGWVSLCSKTAPLTSIVLVMAPLPTIQKISQERSVGSLPLLPYSSLVGNAFVWVIYGTNIKSFKDVLCVVQNFISQTLWLGLLKSDAKVYIPNTVGVILGTYYFSQYMKYCQKSPRSSSSGLIEQHLLGVAALISCTLLLTATFTRKVATSIIGKLGVLLCILLFASPLSTLKKVLETKSAKSIPLPFTIACMLNCFLWSVAGVGDMKDFNIYAPNILGLASSIAQLMLKLMYGDGEKTTFQLPL